MDSLETPYEVEANVDFIECEVCSKTIRGDALYKIHLTTYGHMKKEDQLVAQGHAVRHEIVPEFADIMDYLQYLNIDEPIIGLNYLEEKSGSDPNDPQPGPRYACKLCDLDANLPNMINHVIGRKHRQRYLEVKRPDLVTWKNDVPFSSHHSGKIMRTKAEVVERQDGKGTPRSKPLRKSKVGTPNISRVLPQQKKIQNQNQRGVPSRTSQEFTDHPGEYSHHSGRPLDDPHLPPYRTDDRYMSADAERGAYPGEGHPHRRQFVDDDYHGEYRADSEDMSRRNDWRDPREEMSYGRAYHEEAPLYGNPSAGGNDPLREFMEAERGRVPPAEAGESRKRAYPAYADDDPHGRAYQPEGSEHAAPGGGVQGRTSIDYSHGRVPFDIDNHLRQRRAPDDPYSNPRADPHQASYHGDQGRDRAYPEDDPYAYGANPQRRSLDREPGRPGNANGAGRHREPSGQDANLHPEPMEIEEWQEGPAGGDPGFSRRGPPPPPVSNRPPEGARTMSDIPEPFRRFLQGASEDQMNERKRRKKSRFSDATKEELQRAKGMLRKEYTSPDEEMHGPPGQGQGQRTQDIHRAQRPGSYPHPQQGQYNTDSYPRENPASFSGKAPESGNVFDLMNNIEIADKEEADFLKSKLCNLLKEFQAKKIEKSSQKSQSPGGMSAEDHRMSNDQRAPPPSQHDRNYREGPPQGQWASPPGQHDGNFREGPPQDQWASPPGQHERNFREGPGPGRDQWASPPGPHERSFREAPPLGHRPPPPGQHDRNFPEEPQQDGRFENRRGQPQEAGRPQRDRDERGNRQNDRGHRLPGHPQNRGSSRSRYEEVFGGAGQGQQPHAMVPEEPPLYPERFNEPRNPHHHPPGNGQYYDHYPPANAFPGGNQGYGRRPQHTSSLDKITSTLLELVARK